jgi:adenylate kinase family enzyme
MKRILVLGSSGSGKSTVTRGIGDLLGLEIIHLDSYYWKPNWVPTPTDEWGHILEGLLQRDRWVMDGNYPQSLELRLDRADTVVFIDLNRYVCLGRCFWRLILHRGQNRPELAPGCYEKIDGEFLRWIWHYPQDIKPQILEALCRRGETVAQYRLTSARKVEEFLDLLGGSK